MKCPKCKSPSDHIHVNGNEAVIFCGSCLKTHIVVDKDEENFNKIPLFVLRLVVWVGIVSLLVKLRKKL